MAAAANEIGQNPDAGAGGLDGLAKGFGGKESDCGGIAGLKDAGNAVESYNARTLTPSSDPFLEIGT